MQSALPTTDLDPEGGPGRSAPGHSLYILGGRVGPGPRNANMPASASCVYICGSPRPSDVGAVEQNTEGA